jgi:hypothetical protein
MGQFDSDSILAKRVELNYNPCALSSADGGILWRARSILNTRVIALLTLKNLAELSKKSTEPTLFNMLLTLKEITD